jgi:hypothetical protein
MAIESPGKASAAELRQVGGIGCASSFASLSMCPYSSLARVSGLGLLEINSVPRIVIFHGRLSAGDLTLSKFDFGLFG